MPGKALFDGDPADGDVDYAGETEVCWDGQFNSAEIAYTNEAGQADPLKLDPNVPKDDQIQVSCPNGHEWISPVEGT